MSNVNNVNDFFVSTVYDRIYFFARSPIRNAKRFDRAFARETDLFSRILADVCIAPLVIAGTAYTTALGLAVAAVAALTHAIALAVAGVMDLFTAPDARNAITS